MKETCRGEKNAFFPHFLSRAIRQKAPNLIVGRLFEVSSPSSSQINIPRKTQHTHDVARGEGGGNSEKLLKGGKVHCRVKMCGEKCVFAPHLLSVTSAALLRPARPGVLQLRPRPEHLPPRGRVQDGQRRGGRQLR